MPAPNVKSRTHSKRASYREGVEWIALNDEPESFDVDDVAGFISTSLLADLFRKDPAVVAADVVRRRKTFEEAGR